MKVKNGLNDLPHQEIELTLRNLLRTFEIVFEQWSLQGFLDNNVLLVVLINFNDANQVRVVLD